MQPGKKDEGGSLAPDQVGRICVSIGIIARNEQDVIGPMLASVLSQSLFRELARRHCRAEVICVANDCTDRTIEVAEECFRKVAREHADGDWIDAKVVHLPQAGKVNAWNQFVHHLSALEAEYLFLMDADILIRGRNALWNMVCALERNPAAQVSTDQPRKDLEFKSCRNWRDRLSLRMSSLTQAAPGQLCGQLYCIRASTARRIYLPKDLPACDDGLIKGLVCTDFLKEKPQPERICLAAGAEHTFEAYTSPLSVFKNQKRQIIGQTVVHLLLDGALRRLAQEPGEGSLSDALRRKDIEDPDWLKRLVREHLRRARFFWRLYPGMAGLRFRRLGLLPVRRRLACLPAALAGLLLSLAAGWAAWRFLNQGSTQYWPPADRRRRAPESAAVPAGSLLQTENS